MELINTNKEKSLSKKKLKKKLKKIYDKYFQKPFSFHKDNLIMNKFKLSNNQIKWMFQILREKNKSPYQIY